VYGDPHFMTFDGASTVFTNSKINHFWMVHSTDVQIQGYAEGGASKMRGIAVGGELLSGHVLLVTGNAGSAKVLWDGTEILTEDDTEHIEAGAKLYRQTQSEHLPTEEEIRELDGQHNWWESNVGTGLGGNGAQTGWTNPKMNRVYSFLLPQSVEIFVTGYDELEVLIKMPKQAEQGGWCGNFNGNADDDQETPGKINDKKAKGTFLDALPADEDLFLAAGISLIADATEAHRKSDLETRCPDRIQKKAKKNCAHIPEKILRKGCVMDACLTHDVNWATHAADNMEILEVEEGQGIPIFDGHGHCLDQDGRTYSAMEEMQLEIKACLEQLQQLANSPGVRGAQITDGSKCEILQDTEGHGMGIVGSTSLEKGSECWKIL